jgi:hypothetical protein
MKNPYPPTPDYKIPRNIESDPSFTKILSLLQARTRKLRDGSKLNVSLVGLTDTLTNTLLTAYRSGHVIRGLDAAAEKLDHERSGLLKLKQRVAQGERISRLVLMSNDGSKRFYREADRLLERHFPRVLGWVVDIDSSNLGSLLFGPGNSAKIILINHKEAVSQMLVALIQDSNLPIT